MHEKSGVQTRKIQDWPLGRKDCDRSRDETIEFVLAMDLWEDEDFMEYYGRHMPTQHLVLSTSKLARIRTDHKTRSLNLCSGGRPEELFLDAWRLMELKANFDNLA